MPQANSPTLTPITQEQAKRYARQILLPDMDLDGQEALLNARILQIGAGGLGCANAQYLVAAGLGELTLVDDDVVDITNLQRQVLHGEADIGTPKVESAKAALTALSSACQIHTRAERLDETQMFAQVAAHDLVIDCCDNLATRQLINRACVAQQTPLVSAAAIRFEGQISSFSMQTGTPCYQCLSHSFGEQDLSCVEAGVLGPMVGVMGSLQALESIKLLCGIGERLEGKLLILDGKYMSINQFTLAQDPNCSVCAAK